MDTIYHSDGNFRKISKGKFSNDESAWGLHAGISIQLWQKKYP
ncbi:MAG: hypothetical protein QF472_06865 [Candidatus Marinimicrobia bacterium]|nr:hypothetical protein [Candidatus Neomarinimicrobiota bacterium]